MDAQTESSIFEDFWKWRLRESPEFATAIGIHDFDGQLDDLSLQAYQRREQEAINFLEKLKAEEIECVDESQILNHKMLKEELEQYLKGIKYRSYLFPLNQLEGPQVDFPRMIGWMKTDSTSDYEKIISRLQKFPTQLEQTILLLEHGIENKYTMAIESIKAVPDQLEAATLVPVAESKLFKPFLNLPSSFDEECQKSFKIQAETAIREKVFPALKKIAVFLKEKYIPQVRSNPGVFCLNDGLVYYQECLNFHTSTKMTPEEIYNVGKEEVRMITRKMEEIVEKVGFAGSLDEFRLHVKTDSELLFKSEEEMFSRYNSTAAKIKALLGSICKHIPKVQYVIEPVPAEMAPGYPGAYYLNPSIDGTRPGTFYLNTYKVKERSNMEVVSLSLHEAEPGHHLQCAFAMQQTDLPNFRRYLEDRVYYQAPGRFALHTGYLEGWGLYCEYLGEELGLYKNPYDYFGRLSHEMLRACRLVIDTGMHAFKWTRDEAIRFMSENTAMSKTDVICEVDRYITWPGQACAYKIGELKIKELRERAKSILGDKFDVRDFHNIILSTGGVPLQILEDEVMKFVNKML